MIFTKPFRGVEKGKIYPTQFNAGDTVPPELESAAVACGVAQDKAVKPAKGK